MIVSAARALGGLLRDLWDLRTPYDHRCPVCRERAGACLGAHMHSEHTPAEIRDCYAQIRKGAR